MSKSRRGGKPQRSRRRNEKRPHSERDLPDATRDVEPGPPPHAEWRWWPAAVFAVVAATAGGVWSRSRDASNAQHDAAQGSPVSSAAATPEPPWGRVDRPDERELPPLPAGDAPWGEIERQHLTFAQPPGYINTEECSLWHLQPWRFSGYTRENVQRLIEAATADTALRDRMLGMTRCDDVGCSLAATLELEDAMDSRARGVIFNALAAWPENAYQVHASRRHRRHGPWHEMPGLSPSARRLFAQATWRRGDDYLFADIPWICARLETEAERQRALEVIHTRYGLAAWVKVTPTTPLEPLVAWWSRGTSAQHVRGLFEAAARVPGGGRVSVAELLPPMIRRRLGSFPGREEPLYDCFWTALRFFSTSPSARLPGDDGFAAALRHEYQRIPVSQLRFGDVIVLAGADGAVLHAINHVAGDLVVTKNGAYDQRPWVLSSIDDVRALYPLTADLQAWRLRDAPLP